jgi:streptogramin lyase
MLMNRALLPTALVTVLLGGCSLGANAPSLDEATSGGTAPPAGVVQQEIVTLPGEVYDLAYDPARDSLWFAFMSGDSPDVLYQYDLMTHKLSTWSLPPTDHNGFLERVVVAPDGSVWVTEDYTIVRFEPATGEVATKTLQLADVDASPAALTQDDPSPGTWPSAIAFLQNGEAIVARHNVAALLRLDNKLNTLGRIPLPQSLASPGDVADVAGHIFVAPYAGDGSAVVLNEDGSSSAVGASGINRFAQDGSRVASVGPSGVQILDEKAGAVSVASSSGSLFDRAAMTSDGFVTYQRYPGVIERRTKDGQVVTSYPLPREKVQEFNPEGSAVPVSAPDEVGALAVDGEDAIWYADTTKGLLIQLKP